MGLWIALGVVAILVIVFIAYYNRMVVLRNRVKDAWAQIDVQLKRRSDLIPNLVETVKGYAKHEREVFENVTKARSALLSATGPRDAAVAENQLTSALKTLFAVAENYPELKASANFQELQSQLSTTEDKIAYARQFYNDTVMMYNNIIQKFPGNIFASMFHFKEEEFFSVPESDRGAPEVRF